MTTNQVADLPANNSVYLATSDMACMATGSVLLFIRPHAKPKLLVWMSAERAVCHKWPWAKLIVLLTVMLVLYFHNSWPKNGLNDFSCSFQYKLEIQNYDAQFVSLWRIEKHKLELQTPSSGWEKRQTVSIVTLIFNIPIGRISSGSSPDMWSDGWPPFVGGYHWVGIRGTLQMVFLLD